MADTQDDGYDGTTPSPDAEPAPANPWAHPRPGPAAPPSPAPVGTTPPGPAPSASTDSELTQADRDGTAQWATRTGSVWGPPGADHWGYQPPGPGPTGPGPTSAGPTNPWASSPPPAPDAWGSGGGQGGEPPEWAPLGAAEEPKSRRRPLLAAGFLATALIASGAGAAIALAIRANSTNTPANAVTLPSLGKAPLGTKGGLSVAAIASKVEPATVDITAKDPGGEEDEGTGMVLTSSGLVLTNNHVIDGSTSVTAQIDGSGTTYKASVLGDDPVDDVALLQLYGGASFKTVKLGNSNSITVGDQVVAIGNALALSGPETVTDGIISATSRSVSVSDPSSDITENLKGLFQTSAAINPGNSGGPLVDASAQVIGMNTASASSTGGGETASNVGFAIPINAAMGIARRVQAGEASSTVNIGPHAIMGVDVESVACAEGQSNLDDCPGLGNNPFGGFPSGQGGYGYAAPVGKGAVVQDVDQGSPAQSAGLTAGDVIVSVDGRAVDSIEELTGALKHDKVGQPVRVAWVDQQKTNHKATVRLVAGPNL